MGNTAILILISIVAVAAIFSLVYSSRRGETHRQKTSIKVPESRGPNKVG